MSAVVDFHNHLMPGVDDGAQTPAESIAALESFDEQGVSTAIVTPHMDGSLTLRPSELEARLRELDIAWNSLLQSANGSNVRLERGVELLLNVPDPDLSDARLRLAGTKFVLMEFPFMNIPPHSQQALSRVVSGGYMPIIAHPERYHGMMQNIELAREWKQNGAFLQLNGDSLLGRYGAQARDAAVELLRRGWIDYVCSDYHARGPARVAEYRAIIESHGSEQANTLMEVNPARMLQGLVPLPVSPLRVQRKTFWGRVTALFE